MLTKTKIALATALVLGGTAIASAQGFDPNLANRYPGYAEPGRGRSAVPDPVTGELWQAPVALRSVPVARRRSRHLRSAPAALRADPPRGVIPSEESYFDRASKSWDGGGY